MAQLINDDISAAWRALSGDDPVEGWRIIAVSGLDGGALLAGRQFPGNTEALLVGFQSVIMPPPASLPAGAGFRTERVSTGRPGNWLALVRQPHGSLEMFARMVTDVVATLTARERLGEQAMFDLFTGRVRAWQQFMSKVRGALSPEAELGLAGEMECACTLIDAGMGPYSVMEGWKGPLDGLQDFALGGGAVEVKSTLSPAGFPATVHSLGQLDDAVLNPLFVYGCRFGLGREGQTLPERVAQMRARFADDTAALVLFETAMLHAGYVDAQAGFYTRRFVFLGEQFILVDDFFPRLTAGTVPDGIRHARYEIDLDGVQSPRYESDAVVAMTGVR